MRAGRIVVTYEMLRDALRLGSNEIVAIAPQSADDVINRTVSFVLTGDTMPIHIEGSPLVIVKLEQ